MIRIGTPLYSFNYEVKVGGKLIKKGKYEGEHIWGHATGHFKKELEDGLAVAIALHKTFFN